MRKTVLIVDDDAMLRELFALVLADIPGLDIVEAGSAEDAVRMIDSGQRFDLLLTDRRMAGAWGDELIRGLRRRGFRQPMVLVTGDVRVPALPEADAVLPKPCGIDALVSKVRGLLAM
jgi:CheY-like chemotaxis protein